MPSRAARPAFLAAVDRPLARSQAVALSTSPPLSSSARLQSMMPTPVCSRSCLTSSGLIIVVWVIPSKLPSRTPLGGGVDLDLILFVCCLGSAASPGPSLLLLVLLRLWLEDERFAGRQGG